MKPYFSGTNTANSKYKIRNSQFSRFLIFSIFFWNFLKNFFEKKTFRRWFLMISYVPTMPPKPNGVHKINATLRHDNMLRTIETSDKHSLYVAFLEVKWVILKIRGVQFLTKRWTTNKKLYKNCKNTSNFSIQNWSFLT